MIYVYNSGETIESDSLPTKEMEASLATGSRMVRIQPSPEATNPRTRIAKWPIISNSAGINANQIAETKNRYPHHEYTRDGRMVFKSQAHQRQCLADIGMRNRDDYSR